MAQTETPAPAATVESSGWHFMQDGVVYGMSNHQGGPRGGDEFVVPNWWMGMATRKVRRSELTFNDDAQPRPGDGRQERLREIFQVGETLDGRPLIDRQHPHDFFMQLAAVWRTPLSATTGVDPRRRAGRASRRSGRSRSCIGRRRRRIRLAPLGHHTFDSTHIAFGVVTAAVDHGRWMVEGSLFNGREPDENRWDFDFGRLDSVSGAAVVSADASSGSSRFPPAASTSPEELEPGNVTSARRRRRRGSSVNGDDFTAVTAGYGVNVDARHATGTRARGRRRVRSRPQRCSWPRRAGAGGDERSCWRIAVGHARTRREQGHRSARSRPAPCATSCAGAGSKGASARSVTFYAVAGRLDGDAWPPPVSYQMFFRLRPPAGAMGRMWNMRMSQPMKPAADPHAGHIMN